MKLVNYSLIFLLASLMVACSSEENAENESKPTEKELLQSIQVMRDSIMKIESKKVELKDNVSKNLIKIEYINRLLDYYRNFPEGKQAATCLDKVHMTFSGLSSYRKAANWADTLLIKYPNYSNRAMVLESQASTYDIFITPRDSAKVRKYYTMLLEEFPTIDSGKKERTIKRLQYNDLDFDAYIEQQLIEKK